MTVLVHQCQEQRRGHERGNSELFILLARSERSLTATVSRLTRFQAASCTPHMRATLCCTGKAMRQHTTTANPSQGSIRPAPRALTSCCAHVQAAANPFNESVDAYANNGSNTNPVDAYVNSPSKGTRTAPGKTSNAEKAALQQPAAHAAPGKGGEDDIYKVAIEGDGVVLQQEHPNLHDYVAKARHVSMFSIGFTTICAAVGLTFAFRTKRHASPFPYEHSCLNSLHSARCRPGCRVMQFFYLVT